MGFLRVVLILDVPSRQLLPPCRCHGHGHLLLVLSVVGAGDNSGIDLAGDFAWT